MSAELGKILLLEAGPATEGVVRALAPLPQQTIICRDISEAGDAMLRQMVELIVFVAEGGQDIRGALARQQASLELPPILALCAECSGEQIDKVRQEADDALVWPSEEIHLQQRAAAVMQQGRHRRDARLRLLHHHLLQDLSRMLSSAIEFESRIVDTLRQIVGFSCAKEAMVLAQGGQEEALYLMGSTADPNAARLPLSGEEYPEVLWALELGRELRLSSSGSTPGSSFDALELLQQRDASLLWVFPLVWEEQPYGVLEVC